MKTVLFIVTSFWAYGELLIALEFADRMDDDFKAIFLIPSSHKKLVQDKKKQYYTLIPGGGKLNRLLMGDIERTHQPDLVVLSDILNFVFCERHYGITLEDLEIFSGSCGGFDLYDFEKARNKVDTYGFNAKNMKGVSLDCFDFLLQPCPVNQPITGKEIRRIYRYSLFRNISEINDKERERARRKKKIGLDEKVILITSALWQKNYRKYKYVDPFIRVCKKGFEDLLLNLSAKIRIISVGSQFLFKDNTCPGFTHFDKMLPADFNELVNACDLYISNNYISTSMLKIALKGIPVMLLSNSFFKKKDYYKWVNSYKRYQPPILKDCDYVYPFRMFPVGWYRFLEHIVEGNPIYEMVERGEWFEPDKTLDKINNILDIGAEKYRDMRLGYKMSLVNLPEVNEIMMDINKKHYIKEEVI